MARVVESRVLQQLEIEWEAVSSHHWRLVETRETFHLDSAFVRLSRGII